ncbi:hypothetical protein F4778DRAFT_786806 [Xylariomycetidae sp. FL2044]|nr:hypothetical protein F4778DRAFT_786806 [Xylariomycetidae sp. FL2044]
MRLLAQGALLAALLAGSSMASPTDSSVRVPKEKRQNVDWSFSLFQNGQCTGANDTYTGNGDQACTAGIRNGSAAAWWKIFANADCEVFFFDDASCNNNVDAFDEETEPAECTTPPGGEQIVAYEVTCD